MLTWRNLHIIQIGCISLFPFFFRKPLISQRIYTHRPATTTCFLLKLTDPTGRNRPVVTLRSARVASRLTKSLAIYYGWHSDETLYVPVTLFYFDRAPRDRLVKTSYRLFPRIPGIPGGRLGINALPGPALFASSANPLSFNREFARPRAPARAWRNKRTGDFKGLQLLKTQRALRVPFARASFAVRSKSIRRNSASMKRAALILLKFFAARSPNLCRPNKEFCNIESRVDGLDEIQRVAFATDNSERKMMAPPKKICVLLPPHF